MKQSDWSGPCACMGPQDGEPVCPCAMRSVTIKNGRYVRVTDLGPAPGPEQLAYRRLGRADKDRELREFLSKAMDGKQQQP